VWDVFQQLMLAPYSIMISQIEALHMLIVLKTLALVLEWIPSSNPINRIEGHDSINLQQKITLR
jgi:hypothetical protein